MNEVLFPTKYVIQWKGEDFDWENSLGRKVDNATDACDTLKLAREKMPQYQWRALKISTEEIILSENA